MYLLLSVCFCFSSIFISSCVSSILRLLFFTFPLNFFKFCYSLFCYFLPFSPPSYPFLSSLTRFLQISPFFSCSFLILFYSSYSVPLPRSCSIPPPITQWPRGGRVRRAAIFQLLVELPAPLEPTSSHRHTSLLQESESFKAGISSTEAIERPASL
jgi:hypothetical protein